MLKATKFEYRFRYLIHVILYCCGFMLPWEKIWPEPHGLRTWLALAELPSRYGWLSLYAATLTVTALGVVFAFAGAGLRTWGTAYMGAGVVNSGAMHGGDVVADGPYRHVRNPLYLGTWLHTFMLVLLMEPAGAIFTIVTIGWFQLRLIGSEEYFLTGKLGEAYVSYCARVPRLLPSLTARVPASGSKPRWGLAVLAELYFIGAAVSFAVVAWRFNLELLSQCILGALGVGIVAKAFIPGTAKQENPGEQTSL